MGLVLIVEENDPLRKWTGEFVERFGHSALTSGTDTSALGMLSQVPFDVVVASHLLPGTSAVEFVEKMRDNNYWQSVIITTTSYKENLDELKKVAMKVLQKPTDFAFGLKGAINEALENQYQKELLNAVRYVLSRPTGPAYLRRQGN